MSSFSAGPQRWATKVFQVSPRFERRKLTAPRKTVLRLGVSYASVNLWIYFENGTLHSSLTQLFYAVLDANGLRVVVKFVHQVGIGIG